MVGVLIIGSAMAYFSGKTGDEWDNRADSQLSIQKQYDKRFGLMLDNNGNTVEKPGVCSDYGAKTDWGSGVDKRIKNLHVFKGIDNLTEDNIKSSGYVYYRLKSTGRNISSDVKIDLSDVDVNRAGEYNVKLKIINPKNCKYEDDVLKVTVHNLPYVTYNETKILKAGETFNVEDFVSAYDGNGVDISKYINYGGVGVKSSYDGTTIDKINPKTIIDGKITTDRWDTCSAFYISSISVSNYPGKPDIVKFHNGKAVGDVRNMINIENYYSQIKDKPLFKVACK